MNIRIIEAYTHMEDIKILFNEYVSSLGVDLTFQNYAEELSALPGKYAKPLGRLYIAYAEDFPAGCIALRPFDEKRCEMKRLYVRSQFRSLKIGKMLSEKIILEAREIGYDSLLLDTLSSMEKAFALYKRLGFKEIEPYYANPLAGTYFLCLKL